MDRYRDRKKSPREIGIDYERYVGYTYEIRGYKVDYHGAKKGKQDLGIDLICTRDSEVLIIQCKRLSKSKGLPVRENVIAQLHGAAEYYRMKQIQSKKANCKKQFIPVLVTSYELSEEAKLFAKYLKVQVKEHFDVEPYPMIKCNINSSTGEKIFHLPMDQRYDAVVIGDVPGECYQERVKQAEELGFRRAYRYKGNLSACSA